MPKKLATIDIKGKEYVTVATRILAFNELYPEGSITTEILPSQMDNQITFKAWVSPQTNGNRMFTGHSQAVWGDGMVNKTSALENAETSAVGRALAMMGIGIIESVASVDEINKTTHGEPSKRPSNAPKSSDKQIALIEQLLPKINTNRANYENKIRHKLEDLSSAAASKCITTLKDRIANGEVETDDFVTPELLKEIQRD